jgi:hypothetical protein
MLGGYIGGSMANHGGGYAQPVIVTQPGAVVQGVAPAVMEGGGVAMPPAVQYESPLAGVWFIIGLVIFLFVLLCMFRVVWWMFFREDTCRHDRW